MEEEKDVHMNTEQTRAEQSTPTKLEPAQKSTPKKKAPAWAFYVLVLLFVAGIVYEFVREQTSMVLLATWIIFGSIVVVNKKQFFIFEKKDTQQKKTIPQQGSSMETSEFTNKPTEPLWKRKHTYTLLGAGLGALLVLLVAVVIFLPQLYLAIAANRGQADREITTTRVNVERNLSVAANEEQGTEAQDSNEKLLLITDTKYVAPSSWEYKTLLSNEDQSLQDGLEVIVVDNTAYQRAANSDGAYDSYSLEPDPNTQTGSTITPYESTAQAIESSSFFQPGILDFAGTPRFVWNTQGQPWWYLHYRMPIDVAALEAAAPDWYVPDLYPFGADPQLGAQDISFVVDVWVNPFTGRVMHEMWDIEKISDDDPTYSVQLMIDMDRDFAYPSDLTIEAPN